MIRLAGVAVGRMRVGPIAATDVIFTTMREAEIDALNFGPATQP